MILVGSAGIVLAVLLAYGPALRGGLVWDDDAYVANNATLTEAGGLWRIWAVPRDSPQYYPLVFTTFWVEYRLWGLNPLGYHLVNVLLHAAGALLLWAGLRRLAVPGAWLAAAIFALHPVQVESVAWIAERKNVLAGVFYLAAAWAYLRFALPTGEDAGAGRAWRFYALAVVLFLGALLSKTVTCTLPAALLLVLWWKRRRLGRRDLLPLVPLLAGGAAMGLLTAWVERHVVGAEGGEWSLSLLERCLLAGRVVWFYLGKLAWPANLVFIYPRWQIDAGVWWQYLFPLGCLAVLAGLWVLRGRLGRGPMAAGLFFLVTLVPALGFFRVYFMRYSFVADHFQYLASMGPITAGAALIVWVTGLPGLAQTAGSGPGRRAAMRAAQRIGARQVVGYALCVAVLAALGAGTWRRSQVFANVEGLWEDTLKANPSAWMAHNNLGHYLWHRGERDRAGWHFAEHVRLRPGDAEAHNHLANALAYQGRLEEAAAEYTEALRLRPDLVPAHHNLGTIRDRQGNVPEAIAHYSAALGLDPYHRQARTNLAELLERLAVAYLRRGRLDEAMAAATSAREVAAPLGDAELTRRIDECIGWCAARRPATRP